MRSAGGRGLALVLDRDREIAALWRNHAAAQEAKSRVALFMHYQGFARAVALGLARRMPQVGLDHEDFIQLAEEALLQAIDRFDPNIGSRFESYARTRITGHIRNGALKASEASAQYSYRRRLETDRLRSIVATPDGEANWSVDVLAAIAAKIALGFILEQRDTPDPDALPSADPSAYDTLAWRQMSAELDLRLAQLPEQEAFVLERHYRHGEQFQQIALLLGLSKGRISQLHGQGVQRLRRQMSKFA